MKMILGFLALFLSLIALVGMFLSLISVITLGGYVMIRLVLRILGLHKASSTQFRSELKFAATFGVLLLTTFVLVFLPALAGNWLGWDG